MTNTQKIFLIGALVVIAGVGSYFLFKKKPYKKFLFIGDSTTADPNSYADKFKKQHPEFTVKKIAQSGAKTDWMLQQLSGELRNNDYDVVSILGGSNNIFGELKTDNAKRDLQAMYDLAKKSGAKVVAITMPYKGFYAPTTDKHRALIADLVKWIKNNREVDYFIDLGSLVTDKSLFNSDMQHINSKGHDILELAFNQKVT